MDPLGVTGLTAGRSTLAFPTDSSGVPFFMTGFDASFGLYQSLGVAELLVAKVLVSASDTLNVSTVDIASGRRTKHKLVRPSATSAAVDFFMIAWTRFTTDEHGHILSADMRETTEKTRSVRSDPIDIAAAAKAFAERDKSGTGLGVASPNEQVTGSVGGKAGQSGRWGTSYDASKDVARVPMQTQTLGTPQGSFAITIVRTGNNSAELRIAWDTFIWSVPVTTR